MRRQESASQPRIQRTTAFPSKPSPRRQKPPQQRDRESRFLLVSAGWLAALAHGRSPEEVIGKTDFDIFSRPHATTAFTDEQRVIVTGQPMLAKVERETFHDRPHAWESINK